MMPPLPDAPVLMIVTDRGATRGRSLVAVVARAVEGGADLVQLREKDLDGRELLTLARELREVTRRGDARLLVNDRIDVALACDAAGVVLPAQSFPTAVARRLLGNGRIVARSTHSAWEARKAAAEGCDLVLFGPVWETPSKRAYGEPQGLDRLRETAKCGAPVIAIGGIDAARAAEARNAGAAGVAVIRAVLEAGDPAAAASALRDAPER